MQERKRIGDIPVEIMNALAAIRRGDKDTNLWNPINEWMKDNDLRQNQIAAELELEQSDYGSSHSHPIIPTQGGTGLSRQGKIPRDLRVSE